MVVFITGLTGTAGNHEVSSIYWKAETYINTQQLKVWPLLKCCGIMRSRRRCL
ncbi:hypothetical protein SAMN05443246_0071 [Paenibacillus sp. GP183]|nr:hypothetical protein SAMN05443246_0071 [Paenibacillus sp. GP183]